MMLAMKKIVSVPVTIRMSNGDTYQIVAKGESTNFPDFLEAFQDYVDRYMIDAESAGSPCVNIGSVATKAFGDYRDWKGRTFLALNGKVICQDLLAHECRVELFREHVTSFYEEMLECDDCDECDCEERESEYKDDAEEAKKKIDLMKVVAKHAKLKKSGKMYMCCSPLHEERTPSFAVCPEKQLWYDFGVSDGGDVIDFVQKVENCPRDKAEHIVSELAKQDEYSL